MDNTINQTIIEKVAIQKTAIYKAIAMLPPPEIKDLWAEKNSTDQKVNLTKKEEFVKENSITETKTDSMPKDWRDITDPKLRKKMRIEAWRENNKNKINKKYNLRIKNDPIFKEYRRNLARNNYKKRTFRRLLRSLKKSNRDHLKINVSVRQWDLWKIAKKQRLKCALTGRKLTNENISLDHIIPTSKGGTHDISNLRLVVLHANLAKLNYSDNELLELAKDIVTTLQ